MKVPINRPPGFSPVEGAKNSIATVAPAVTRAPEVAGEQASFEARSPLRALRRQVQPVPPATLLTPAELGLPDAPTAVPAKAIVSDAHELLKQSGVQPFNALNVAAERLGITLQKPNGLSDTAGFLALGPSVLPLVRSAEVPTVLSQWRGLRLTDVLPTLLEQANATPDLYPERLAALSTNPSLTDGDAMALFDARQRTHEAGAPRGPSEGPAPTLDSLLTQVRTLDDGPLVGEAVHLVRRLLEKGHQVEPGRVQALADAALSSADASTRSQAGLLFWQSSFANEAGLKTYLQSVFAPSGAPWSEARLHSTLEAFEHGASSSKPDTRIDPETAMVAMRALVRNAPATADVGPLAASLMWPDWHGHSWETLKDEIRAAIAWSTAPVERRITAADQLNRIGDDPQTTQLLVELLRQNPELARHAPRLLAAQLGVTGPAKEATASPEVARLGQAADYFAELRRMKSELEALEQYPRALRHLELKTINDVLTPPTEENVFELMNRGEGYRGLALQHARETGLSGQELLDAAVAAGRRVDEELLLPGVSEASFREHLVKRLALTNGSDFMEGYLEPLVKRRFSREAVVDILQQGIDAGIWPKLGQSLVAAGFSRPLVAALTRVPGQPQPPSVVIEPSNDPVRGLAQARRERVADFRARASGEAPYLKAASKVTMLTQAATDADLASLTGAPDEAAAERAAVALFARERIKKWPAFDSAVLAVLQAGPSSLDGLVPTLSALVADGALGLQPFAAMGELMKSPKMSKSAALELAWAAAEKANWRSSFNSTTTHLGSEVEEPARAAFHTVLRFADERADLTDAERDELKQAMAYLAKTMPAVTRNYG